MRWSSIALFLFNPFLNAYMTPSLVSHLIVFGVVLFCRKCPSPFSRAKIIIREPIFLNEWMNPSSASNRFFITAQSWFHIFVRERFTATEWAKRRLDIKLEHNHFYMSRVDHKIKFLVFIKKNISWLFILIITGINNFAASFCPDDRSLSSRWIYKTPSLSFLWVLSLEDHAAWFMHHSLKSNAS